MAVYIFVLLTIIGRETQPKPVFRVDTNLFIHVFYNYINMHSRYEYHIYPCSLFCLFKVTRRDNAIHSLELKLLKIEDDKRRITTEVIICLLLKSFFVFIV